MTRSASEDPSSTWMTSVLAKLRKLPDAGPFLKPVDWKRMCLDDYPRIVSTPMDLQTVGRRVRDGHYIEDPQRFTEDLKLIWANCRTYNGEKSDIGAMANRMEKHMYELLAEHANAAAAAPVVVKEEDEDTKNRRRRRSDGSETPQPGSKRGRPPNRPPPPPVVVQAPIAAELSPLKQGLIQKFVERLVRLNPQHMYHMLQLLTKNDASCSRPTSNTVEVDMTTFDDAELMMLTSVCKCLLYHQTVAT